MLQIVASLMIIIYNHNSFIKQATGREYDTNTLLYFCILIEFNFKQFHTSQMGQPSVLLLKALWFKQAQRCDVYRSEVALSFTNGVSEANVVK